MENAHPIFVHFPVALLTSALVLETVGLIFRRKSWRRVALWNLALGTAAAALAVLTGRAAAATAKHSFEVHQVMTQHERLGYLVLSLAVTTFGWAVATRDRRPRDRCQAPFWRGAWHQVLGWGLLVATCLALAYGAHLGGRLVYEYGVGGSFGRAVGGIEVVD